MKLAVTCLLVLACFSVNTEARKRHGFILLHGLGGGLGPAFCVLVSRGLMLNEDDVRVECPEAKCRSHTLLPPTLIKDLFPILPVCVPSWFNFRQMPVTSVLSPGYPSDPDELAAAAKIVEDLIEDMINDGIPSENIVLTGASQGGVLTLYQAVHSKYKLGAFVPIVTWYGNLQEDGPENYPNPVNKHTPILQFNGMADFVVPVVPAGKLTEEAMRGVFTNYDINYIPFTGHGTTTNPITFRMMRKFYKKHNLLSFCLTPLCLFK